MMSFQPSEVHAASSPGTSVRCRVSSVLLLLVFVLSACNNEAEVPASGVQPGTIHPTAMNILDDAEVNLIIRIADPATGTDEALSRFAQRLSAMPAILSIGVEEGNLYEMLGNVVDLTTDEDGRIYVLDERYNEVRIFDREGRFVQAFGGPGEGPSEFFAPVAIERSDQGKLLVLARNRHLKVFQPQGATFVLETDITLDFNPDALCMLNDRAYVRGFRQDEQGEETIIHVFSLDGERLLSFGEAYKAPDTFVKSMMSMGYGIACSEETQTVITMFESLPVVYGYTPDGALKWTMKLADFKPLNITELLSENGGTRLRNPRPEPGTTFSRHVEALDHGYVVVQLMRAGDTPGKYMTYLISTGQEQGLYVEKTLPKLFRGAPGLIIGESPIPFPQVSVYTMAASS